MTEALQDDPTVRPGPDGGAGALFTLGQLFDPTSSRLEALVSAGEVEQLKALSDTFPLAVTSAVGFEFHDRSPAVADLLIPVSVAGRQVLVDGAREGVLRGCPRDEATWDGLSQLAASWGDPASRLYERLLTIWLEFDRLSGAAGFQPTPFVIMSLSDDGWLVQGDDPSWLLEQELPLLLGRALDSRTRDLVLGCMTELDPGAGIADIGLAASRTPVAVRLNIKGLSSEGIADYAERIGWPGTIHDRRRLDALIAELEPWVPTIKLCVDVWTDVGPRLGLECPISLEQRLTSEGWEPLLRVVERRGLLRHGFVDALLAYVGVSSRQDGQPWPPALRTAAVLLGDRFDSVIVRDLSHVKVDVGAQGSEAAKAYGYLGYGWRRTGR